MKYPPRNTAQNEVKKQFVFSEKMMGSIRMKLKQFAEIEFLLHAQKTEKVQKRKIKK